MALSTSRTHVLPASDRPLRRLVVRNGDRIAIVAAEEVDWIGSADNYVVLHVGRTTHVLRESLNTLEGRLDAQFFLWLSRSSLVNLRRIREILQTKAGHAVVMPDSQHLPITRGIREVLTRLETA